MNNIVDKFEQCWRHKLFNAVFINPEQSISPTSWPPRFLFQYEQLSENSRSLQKINAAQKIEQVKLHSVCLFKRLTCKTSPSLLPVTYTVTPPPFSLLHIQHTLFPVTYTTTPPCYIYSHTSPSRWYIYSHTHPSPCFIYSQSNATENI